MSFLKEKTRTIFNEIGNMRGHEKTKVWNGPDPYSRVNSQNVAFNLRIDYLSCSFLDDFSKPWLFLISFLQEFGLIQECFLSNGTKKQKLPQVPKDALDYYLSTEYETVNNISKMKVTLSFPGEKATQILNYILTSKDLTALLTDKIMVFSLVDVRLSEKKEGFICPHTKIATFLKKIPVTHVKKQQHKGCLFSSPEGVTLYCKVHKSINWKWYTKYPDLLLPGSPETAQADELISECTFTGTSLNQLWRHTNRGAGTELDFFSILWKGFREELLEFRTIKDPLLVNQFRFLIDESWPETAHFYAATLNTRFKEIKRGVTKTLENSDVPAEIVNPITMKAGQLLLVLNLVADLSGRITGVDQLQVRIKPRKLFDLLGWVYSTKSLTELKAQLRWLMGLIISTERVGVRKSRFTEQSVVISYTIKQGTADSLVVTLSPTALKKLFSAENRFSSLHFSEVKIAYLQTFGENLRRTTVPAHVYRLSLVVLDLAFNTKDTSREIIYVVGKHSSRASLLPLLSQLVLSLGGQITGQTITKKYVQIQLTFFGCPGSPSIKFQKSA
jgi:hypothetical protein